MKRYIIKKRINGFLRPVNIITIWAVAMTAGLIFQSVGLSRNNSFPALSSSASVMPIEDQSLSNNDQPVFDNSDDQPGLFSSINTELERVSYKDLDFKTSVDNDKPKRWVTVRMRVTGYCACSKCCGKFSDGKTANGHRIKWGDRFVAAPKHIPFGTEMIIPGYNHGKSVKVADRGRVIRGNRLDVFYNTHYTASRWGVKYIDVKVRY